MDSESEGETRAELYVRGELPPPARERAVHMERRLDDLEAGGTLEDLRRETWPKRVPVADCDGVVRDRYLAFRAWAAEAGARLQPFFGTRACYCTDGDGKENWLVLPAVCLAVYERDDLAAVYPHGVGDETHTVEDGLAAIAPGAGAGAEPATLPAD
jgi:hypothetical protein